MLNTIPTDAKLPFIVRTIYFKPLDAPSRTDKINQLMENVRLLYLTEMMKHGYGSKTFRLEREGDGDVVVHTINGKHNIAYYEMSKTFESIREELPPELKNSNNIHVIVVARLRYVNNQKWGLGIPICGSACGGNVVVSKESGHFGMQLIAHELGHAFGLYHNVTGYPSIMGVGATGAESVNELSDYESRWLNKHHYFNNAHHINDVPIIGNPNIRKDIPLIEVQQNININFRFDVKSTNELYQAQILKEPNADILDWKRLSGKQDTVVFRICRSKLVDAAHLQVQVMDTHGNINLLSVNKDKYQSLLVI